MYSGDARFSTKSFSPALASSDPSVTAGSQPRMVAERGDSGGEGRKESA